MKSLKSISVLVGALALIALGFFIGMGISPSDSTEGHGPPGPGRSAGAEYSGGGYPELGAGDASDGAPVVTAQVLVATIRERISGTGNLEPEREVTVTARVEGTVESLPVEVGDTVAAHAPLCEIDKQWLQISERQAAIQHERDRAEAERMQELSRLSGESRRAISSKEIEEAQYAMQASSAAHDQAKLNLSYSEPRAAFTGVVVRRHVELGQHVRPGDPIVDLADVEPLLVRLYLPEKDARRVRVGQIAELRREREGAAVAVGEVLRISPIVDTSSLNVEVVTSFDRVPEPLRPGSFVRVSIITRTLDDVLLVPRSALIRKKDIPPHVFRVLPDRRAQRVEVSTGYEDESVVEIRDGALQRDDLLVVEGYGELKDTDLVREYRRVPVRGNPLNVLPNRDD